MEPTSRRSGKRPGAGAPRGNLNALKHGMRSKILKRAITAMAENPELKDLVYAFAHLGTQGNIPAETRRLIRILTSEDSTDVLKRVKNRSTKSGSTSHI